MIPPSRSVLAVALVVLVLSVLPAVAQNPDAGTSAVPVRGATFSLAPSPLDWNTTGPPGLPAGYEGPLWLHVRTNNASFRDTATLQGSRVNVTPQRVVLEAGPDGVASALVRVEDVTWTLEGPDPSIHVQLENTTYRGTPLMWSREIIVYPPASVDLEHPEPVRPRDEAAEPGPGVIREEPVSLELDWSEEVTVRVRVTNPWTVPSDPFPVTVASSRKLLADLTVPALDPGETQVLDVGSFGRQDVQKMGSGWSRGGPDKMEAPISLLRGDVFPQRLVAVEAYEVRDGTVEERRAPRAEVRWWKGVSVEVESSHMELGEPSWTTLRLHHHGGEEAQTLRLKAHVTPLPNTLHGPGSYVAEEHIVRIPPGADHILNVTFEPRVAAPHQVDLRAPGGTFTQSRRVVLPSPLRVLPVGEPVTRASVGEEVAVRFTMESTRAFEDAPVRVAVAPLGAEEGGEPPSLSRFVTVDDILWVDAPRVTVPANGSVNVTVRVTPQGAGAFLLVPTLGGPDGLRYAGVADVPVHRFTSIFFPERTARMADAEPLTGVLGLAVAAGPLGGIVWAPLVGMTALAGGVVTARRRYVR